MESKERTVYITGITGNIGRLLAEGLSKRWTVRGNSRRGTPVPGAQVSKGDVADASFIQRELEGVDTVIHLAADPSPRASWESVLKNNIDGTYKVYEAARQAGVKRIIFASTNHTTGILTEKVVDMDTSVPFRPDSYYGVSKALGEVLGRYYSDRYGMSVLNFRIGWIVPTRDEKEIVDIFKSRKDAYPLMWLSPSDCLHAHEKGIEAPESLRFGTYYIMSNNKDMLWDMSNAKEEIGYEPKDDLAVLFERFGERYDFRIPSDGLGG